MISGIVKDKAFGLDGFSMAFFQIFLRDYKRRCDVSFLRFSPFRNLKIWKNLLMLLSLLSFPINLGLLSLRIFDPLAL